MVNKVTETRLVLRAVTEPVDAQHRCGSGKFHKDLDVVVERGAGRVGRTEEKAGPASVLEGEDLGVQSDEAPAGIIG